MAVDIERLYRTHGPMVLRRCRRLLRDPEKSDRRHPEDRDEALLLAIAAEGEDAPEQRALARRIDAGLALADGDAEINNLVGPDGVVYPPLASKFTSVSVQQPSGEWRLEHLRAYIFLQPGG
jgi:hypothetical protein